MEKSTLILNKDELNDFQKKQQQHDIVYHPDILSLGINRRIVHVTLHLTKYLYAIFTHEKDSTAYKKSFTDSFIMIISAANQLGILLSGINAPNIQEYNFINCFMKQIAELAKACESSDHQEDFPIRATWNNSIINLFYIFLREANADKIDILSAAFERIASVENENILVTLFQDKS